MWFYIIVILILLIISYIDFKTMEIPNTLTLLLIISGLSYNWYFNDRLFSAFIGMGVYSLPFSLIYGYVSDLYDKEVLGFGDVKLAMGIGAVLTYRNFYDLYLFFFASFLLAAIYAIFLLIKIKKRDIEFPFGPFISISGSIMILMGSVL